MAQPDVILSKSSAAADYGEAAFSEKRQPGETR